VSEGKKQVRAAFREAVFERDGHCCKVCGEPGVDAHHITDRHNLPKGGYVLANGITLCSRCHEIAEGCLQTCLQTPGYTPADLYRLIGSSLDSAWAAAKRV